jgi:hypothetical protein
MNASYPPIIFGSSALGNLYEALSYMVPATLQSKTLKMSSATCKKHLTSL